MARHAATPRPFWAPIIAAVAELLPRSPRARTAPTAPAYAAPGAEPHRMYIRVTCPLCNEEYVSHRESIAPTLEHLMTTHPVEWQKALEETGHDW